MLDVSVSVILILAAAALVIAVLAVTWFVVRARRASGAHGRQASPPTEASESTAMSAIAGPGPNQPILWVHEDEDAPTAPVGKGDPLLGLDSSGGLGRLVRAAGTVASVSAIGALLTGALLFQPNGGQAHSPWSAATNPDRLFRTEPVAPAAYSGATERESATAAAELASRPAVVDPATGMRLVAWSGDGQIGVPGRRLRSSLSVVLRDSANRAVAGTPVTFRVSAGGGRVQPGRTRTSDVGLASTVWWIGERADSLLVTATVEGRPGLRLQFTASLEGEAFPRDIVALEEPERSAADAEATLDPVPGPATADSSTRAPVAGAPAALPAGHRLATGGVHSCELAANGSVHCWGGGARASGEVAAGLRTISGGVLEACGVTSDGGVACWNAGRGTPPGSTDVVSLPGGANAVDVVSGSDHRCALSADRAVFCWGSNAHGQLGNGSSTDATEPVRVPGLPAIRVLAAGWLHTCALTMDGQAYCWGANAAGQLGDGTGMERRQPARVAHNGRFLDLAAGSTHTCGLAADGRVSCWGSNARGQLGAGELDSARRPVAVEAGVRFRAVVTGGAHTCALTSDGTAWCWGQNSFGQVGNRTTDDVRVPVPVGARLRFEALSAGGAHTCGRERGGDLYCWGNNVQGQLGDGTRENRSVPTPVTSS